MDSRWAIAYGPRLLQVHIVSSLSRSFVFDIDIRSVSEQGCFAAANDYFVHKLALVYFDRTAARWALFCNLLSWFTFYVMVRPYSNSIETLCTTAALAYWPWAFLVRRSKSQLQAPDD